MTSVTPESLQPLPDPGRTSDTHAEGDTRILRLSMTQHSQITEFSQRPQPGMDILRKGAAMRGGGPTPRRAARIFAQGGPGYPGPYLLLWPTGKSGQGGNGVAAHPPPSRIAQEIAKERARAATRRLGVSVVVTRQSPGTQQGLMSPTSFYR